MINIIFDRLEKRSVDINDWKDIYSFAKGYEGSMDSESLKESTYFSCLKIISESVAKCTLQVKKETEKGEVIAKEHYLTELLRLRPNPYMSAIDFMKTFVVLA